MKNSGNLFEVFDFDTWRRFQHELQNESERGAALVGSAFLEKLLGQLLVRNLVDDESALTELLSGSYAPFGPFSARIDVAYCLGLISGKERRDLTRVRRIRNGFAHGFPGRSFSDQSIEDRCAELEYAQMAYDLLGRGQNSPYPVRNRYIDTVSMLATFLQMRIELPENRPQSPPAPSFTEPHDMNSSK